MLSCPLGDCYHNVCSLNKHYKQHNPTGFVAGAAPGRMPVSDYWSNFKQLPEAAHYSDARQQHPCDACDARGAMEDSAGWLGATRLLFSMIDQLINHYELVC